MFELLKNAKITEVVGETATGTSTVNSAEVDMANYEAVVFITTLGTAAANNGHKVQQDTVTGMAGAADLEGSQLLCNGTGKVVMSEVVRPRERFVRAAVIRGTTTTIKSVIAIQLIPRTVSQTNHVTNVSAAETLVSPIEGTA